ncbi:MAG: ABC transporter permease [Provencibacterium sp.]|jgi:teichoic acid transport system permease protein|nr:ABC transporter permease [Provencibacterium sp.]
MLSEKEIKIKAELTGINRLYVECLNQEEAYTYAFYVMKDGKVLEKIWYAASPHTVYWVTEPGLYSVKVFVRNQQGERVSRLSPEITFAGMKPVYCSGTNGNEHWKWLKDIQRVLMEIWTNRARMFRLALYDYQVSNKDSYLGMLWSILNPLIQILTYWFVFGLGIRSGRPVDGHPFLPWMLCGLIPWFFINSALVQGAASIYMKSSTVLRLRFPVATIPMGSVLVAFFNHAVTLGILLVMLLCFGYFPNFYWLNLLYYLFFELVLFTLLAMVTSVLTMIARDFQKLINSLIRLLFYLTPILWTVDRLPAWAQFILKLNPVLYIVDGFRDSLLYQIPFYHHMKRLLFFWCINVGLLVLGCSLQRKYRNKFIDML